MDLVNHLDYTTDNGALCQYACDIEPQLDFIPKRDALTLTKDDVLKSDFIITNPPWTPKILHSMIEHFRQLKPTWLLFYSDWMFTKQARPYLKYCSDIVSVGRVKWIPDSKYTGKDNCAWYKFIDKETLTVFHNKELND